jgi:hypothetical protein
MLGSHRSLGWSYNYTYMTYICQLYIRGMGLFLGDIHLGMCGRCRASCGSHPHQHKCFSVAFRPWFVGDLRTFCSVHAQLILRDSPMFSKKIGIVSAFKTPLLCKILWGSRGFWIVEHILTRLYGAHPRDLPAFQLHTWRFPSMGIPQ